MDEHAITFRLPKELHRRLRRLAFEMETTMVAIAIEGIEARVAELEAARGAGEDAGPS